MPTANSEAAAVAEAFEVYWMPAVMSTEPAVTVMVTDELDTLAWYAMTTAMACLLAVSYSLT